MAKSTSAIRNQVEKILEFNADPLQFLQKDASEHPKFSRFKFGAKSFVHVFSPTIIKHVLLSNCKNYSKSDEYEALKIVFGNGLSTNDGDSWLKQRRMVQPLFYKKHLETFSTQMQSCTKTIIKKWMKSECGVIDDLYAEMMELNLAIISRSLFGNDMNDKMKDLTQAINAIVNELSICVQNAVGLSILPQSETVLRQNAAIIKSLITDIIIRRKKSSKTYFDLLNMLMYAEDTDSKEKMNDAQLINEVITLLVGGHEPAASALTFVLYLIYTHPNEYDKLCAEVKTLEGRAPGANELKNLSYTQQVINEALRLYPPVWNITRKAIAADEVEELKINKNDTILISPYVMHRNPKYWESPTAFIPERFVEKNKIDNYTYFPFGRGPRTCIGNNFALMSMTISLVLIVQRLVLKIKNTEELKLKSLITIHPFNKLSFEVNSI